MSNDQQPFSKFATKPGSAGAGPAKAKAGWIVCGLLAVATGVLVFFWKADHDRLEALQTLPRELDTATNRLAVAQTEGEQARVQLAALQGRVAELEKEKERATQAAKGLEDELRSELESRDVTISKLQGKLTVNILDRVMFDSAEAVVKPDGEAVLRKVAEILASHPELKIQVIGHTDNVPVHNKYASNWELSMARALAAVHFFTEKAGVDPRRVGAVGYGEYRPIADNATPEGRARNRRIAITILPDELALALADALTEARTNAPVEIKPRTAAPVAPSGTNAPTGPPAPEAKLK